MMKSLNLPTSLARQLVLTVGFLLVIQMNLIAQPAPLRGYLSAHDPSTIIKCNGRYYQFWTGQGILSKSSTDKVFWSPGPPVFSTPPAWTTSAVPGFSGIFWAPDILYFNGQYHLYYAVSTFGSQVSAIGLVTNPTLDPTDPNYQWTDQGPVITSTNGSPYNTIDPGFCWDNSGNLWMVFGSYWNGIYLVQLNSTTGLRVSPNSPTYHLAYNSSIEASYLWRRGGYYYLFVNWGSCCSGVNSTYNIRVGRSTSITGPYLDKDGIDMVNGGGSLFMQANGKYTGPGHVGILNEEGTLSLTCHYYDANSWSPGYNAYGSPDFALFPLYWTADDWPYVTNDWSAQYNFQADARDDNGQCSGLLENGASITTDPIYGHVLNLDGTNQYVWLPPGVGYAETFVAVVNWRGGAPWQRIFDFGFDTSRSVLMTPASGDNVLRCDINPGGNLQTIQWNQPLPTNTWTQVALTLDGSRGVLYVNGAPVVTNNSMNVLPLNVEPQTNSLGRSKFIADAYFNGKYASFRVYGRALSPAEMVAPLPTITQPAEGATYQPGNILNFSGSATDFASRPLSVSNLTWQISYAQDDQTNIVFGPVTGLMAGGYNIPTNATGGGKYIVQLTATDNANHQSTVSVTLLPAHPSGGWESYYPLKSNADDASGNNNGALHGGASFVNDPTRGDVLYLNGTNQYVSFPPELGGMKTFMAWVKWDGGAAWQRIYDFGNDTNRYSVLTPLASSGKLRFNISIDSIPGEQIVDAPAALPVNVWTHVAVVMNGTSVVLYTNGTPVATNLFANLLPADLNATNFYFGKSEWPGDPYFKGEISSARIFSRPLSSNEIVAPQINIAQPLPGAVYQPGGTIAFGGSANDFSDAPIAAAGLTWMVNYINGSSTNTVVGPLNGVNGGTFNIPSSGVAATNGFYQIQLVAVDSAWRSATNSVAIYPAVQTIPAGWASFYPFTNGAQDVSNNFNGTLKNGASIVSDPVRGNVLNLSSSFSQYVSLPADASAAQTISGWVKWNGGNSWQRIFDFGQSTSDFFFFTPSDGSGLPQCGMTANSGFYIQTLESPVPMPVNQWTHFAVVMNGREGILYLNGKAMAVNNSVNLLPSDIAATNCYLGKSQFTVDPYFSGRMSTFHLNSGPVSLDQLISPLPTITQPTNGALFAGGRTMEFAGAGNDYSGQILPPDSFSWSVEFHSNDVVYPVLGPLTAVTNGDFVVPTNGPANGNLFYRVLLTVTDTNNYQQTASLDLPPLVSSLNLDTVPSGLQLALDGATFNTPSNLMLVAGYTRNLHALETQNLSGTNYNFVLWSDGGGQSHSISVPTTNGSLVASYVLPKLLIQKNGSNIVLSWPDWAAPLNLYGTTNLSPPVNWTLVTNAVSASNDVQIVELPLSQQNIFLKLKSP